MRLALSNGTGNCDPVFDTPLICKAGDRKEASCREAPPRDKYTDMFATPSLSETAAGMTSNLGRLRTPACTTGSIASTRVLFPGDWIGSRLAPMSMIIREMPLAGSVASSAIAAFTEC